MPLGTRTIFAFSFIPLATVTIMVQCQNNHSERTQCHITGYSSGTITFGAPLENSYTTGAQILVLFDHGKIDIGSGFSWTSKAWNGATGGILAFSCGLLTGAGNISAIGCGYRGGTGGVNTTVETAAKVRLVLVADVAARMAWAVVVEQTSAQVVLLVERMVLLISQP